MIEQQDIDLIERIREGDHEAEHELFKRFGMRIVRKVRFSVGKNREDWKDIVSEAQMAVLVSLREGKFDMMKGIPLGSYIYGITKNKILDYFKLQKKKESRDAGPPKETDSWTDGEFDLEREEIKKLLRKAIGNLKLKYKQVLYLKYYEGFSVGQVSKMIKLPPRRVSERINYAVKLLRKECEKENIFSILAGVFLIII